MMKKKKQDEWIQKMRVNEFLYYQNLNAIIKI